MFLYYGVVPLLLLCSYSFFGYDIEFLLNDPETIDLFNIESFYRARNPVKFINPIFCLTMVIGEIYWIWQKPNLITITSAIILIGLFFNGGTNIVGPKNLLLDDDQKIEPHQRRILWRQVGVGHLIDVIGFSLVLGMTYYDDFKLLSYIFNSV